MNYIGLNKYDTANGEGVRVSLFVSGCSLHCKGCFNQESWDKNAGNEFTIETLWGIFKSLDNEYIEGLSILGGDPLEDYNIEAVTAICKEVKKNYPKKTIWLWTGRKYDKYKDHTIMNYIDVLVDGAFVEALKIKNEGNRQEYRGSSNQRVIPIVRANEATL